MEETTVWQTAAASAPGIALFLNTRGVQSRGGGGNQRRREGLGVKEKRLRVLQKGIASTSAAKEAPGAQ